MNNIHDVTSQCGMNDLGIQIFFLATQYQPTYLPSNETTLWTTDITVVVNTVPVTQDIKIVLLSQCSHQCNGGLLRLSLQLRNSISLPQTPQLFELLIIVQRLSNSFINVYCLVIQPDGKAIKGPWIDVEKVEFQGFGLNIIAVAMEVVEEDAVLGEDTERDMEGPAPVDTVSNGEGNSGPA